MNWMQKTIQQIVETYQERVRNTCFRYVHSREDADEVAQDVFVQVHASLNRFRKDAELSTWIYRIAVNKSLDFLRYKKRKKRFAQVISLFGLAGEIRNIPEPGGGNPHKDIEAEERSRQLKMALDKLPDTQKTAVILKRFQACKNKEISEIMEISVSAVEALQHRAMKNMKKYLTAYFEKVL
ncbi:MAG: RNA polymerase sigma factor [Fibrobacteria bacterium]|nr:RNA polymerase sigma factor [Fibrobacteria bacterium]